MHFHVESENADDIESESQKVTTTKERKNTRKWKMAYNLIN